MKSESVRCIMYSDTDAPHETVMLSVNVSRPSHSPVWLCVFVCVCVCNSSALWLIKLINCSYNETVTMSNVRGRHLNYTITRIYTVTIDRVITNTLILTCVTTSWSRVTTSTSTDLVPLFFSSSPAFVSLSFILATSWLSLIDRRQIYVTLTLWHDKLHIT